MNDPKNSKMKTLLTCLKSCKSQLDAGQLETGQIETPLVRFAEGDVVALKRMRINWLEP